MNIKQDTNSVKTAILKAENGNRICSNCGNEMSIRSKQSGENAGNYFWVCSKFPDCRTVEACDVDETPATVSHVVTKGDSRHKYVKEVIAVLLLILLVFTLLNRDRIRTTLGIGQKEQSNSIEVLSNDGEYQLPENANSSGRNNSSTTEVVVIDNRAHVPVMISYKGKTVKLQLVVDTGATGITVSQAVAEKLGISLEDTKSGSITIADGSKVNAAHIIADRVTVGPKTVRNIELVVIPSVEDEYTGLLGMSFLGEFPHVLDIKTKTIKWL